jgi:hypothetical protein
MIRKERNSSVRQMKILIISICTVVVWRQILDLVFITDLHGSQIQVVVLQRNVLNIFLILTMCFSIRETVRTMQKQEQQQLDYLQK